MRACQAVRALAEQHGRNDGDAVGDDYKAAQIDVVDTLGALVWDLTVSPPAR